MKLIRKVITESSKTLEEKRELFAVELEKKYGTDSLKVNSDTHKEYLSNSVEFTDTELGKDWFGDEDEIPELGMIGRWVVVRTYSAGVHFGKVHRVDNNQNIIIKNARRLHKFVALADTDSISSISQSGTSTASLINEKQDYIQLNFIEISAVTKGAAATIINSKTFRT